MKKIILILSCSIFYAVSFAQDGEPFGINLSSAEFGEKMPGTYNKEYIYPNAGELDYYKSKGLTLIRLPFRWERIQPELGGNLDSEELNRMKNFLNEAAERKIKVIPDMHNYARRFIKGKEYIIGSPALSIEHLCDAWKKLAEELKTYENIWGYGIMNEPHDMLSETPWFKIVQAVIYKIRETDSQTSIIVSGDSWSSADRWMTYSDNLKKLKDPAGKLIFEAHIYFDGDASGSYKRSYNEEKATPDIGIKRAEPFLKWLKKNNLQGFIGEYGIPDDDPRWLIALDNFLNYLQANCINGTYWAGGPWWGGYKLSVEPSGGKDKPQMSVLEKYKTANKSCY